MPLLPPSPPPPPPSDTYVFNVAADVYAPDLPSQCSGIGNVAAVQYDPEQTQGGVRNTQHTQHTGL